MKLKDISERRLREKIKERKKDGWIQISNIFRDTIELNGQAHIMYSVEIVKLDMMISRRRAI